MVAVAPSELRTADRISRLVNGRYARRIATAEIRTGGRATGYALQTSPYQVRQNRSRIRQQSALNTRSLTWRLVDQGGVAVPDVLTGGTEAEELSVIRSGNHGFR